jgi:hypothetical protein
VLFDIPPRDVRVLTKPAHRQAVFAIAKVVLVWISIEFVRFELQRYQLRAARVLAAHRSSIKSLSKLWIFDNLKSIIQASSDSLQTMVFVNENFRLRALKGVIS